MTVQTLKRMTDYAALARDAHRLRGAEETEVRDRVRGHLIARMGKMRGLPQKLGQMLSFESDDSDDAAEQYAVLQEQAEPLPLEAVRPIMQQAWAADLESVLADIEPTAHAASLGQVHRATTRDGRQVAVKVQYPGIRDCVMADLKMLGWLSLPVGGLRRGFDLASYRQTILEDLERELDYCQEAKQQAAFARWAAADPLIAVPAVVEELSTERVLVTEWQEGDSWQVVRDTWDPSHKRSLAKGLLAFFLRGLFIEGRMQADWHPGNFRFRQRGDQAQLLLYDFGCVYEPIDDHRLALARLIQATIARTEPPWPLFLKLGFDREYLEPMADKLPALCRTLFEPFCVEYPYDMADWQLGPRTSDLLGDDRWNFRIAGPADLIFLLRAFHGLRYYLEKLESPIFWQRPLQSVLEAIRPQMNALEVSAAETATCGFDTLARHLKIRVREGERTKVELTQYAWSIENLESVLDDELKQRIREQGIDLTEVVSDVRRRGYAPGPVFHIDQDNKRVEVWLE